MCARVSHHNPPPAPPPLQVPGGQERAEKDAGRPGIAPATLSNSCSFVGCLLFLLYDRDHKVRYLPIILGRESWSFDQLCVL